MNKLSSGKDAPAENLGADAARDVGETLSGRIRTSLADEIISGAIAPGTEIDEQDLAQRFGASRTPVREALRELASVGLVVIEPRRGARVVAMTTEQIGELFELMAELEAICVRFATYRSSAVERAKLIHIHGAARRAVETNDVDTYDQLNRNFHAAIYEATHNRELQTQALALRQRGAPFRRAQFRGVERLRASWEEHGAILEAIFEGAGEEAARLMRAHMLRAAMVYMDYTESQAAGRPGPAPNGAGAR